MIKARQVQLNFDSKATAILINLQRLRGDKSAAETIAAALALLEWGYAEMAAGRIVGSFVVGGKVKEIQLPLASNADVIPIRDGLSADPPKRKHSEPFAAFTIAFIAVALLSYFLTKAYWAIR